MTEGRKNRHKENRTDGRGGGGGGGARERASKQGQSV